MQKSAETPSNATVPASQEAANEQAKSTIRGILGSDENAWDLVAIITPRTISWTHLAADQRVSYFPPAEPMDPAIVDELRASPFPVPFANSRTVVVRIPCSR
jgi:hypothetical protein